MISPDTIVAVATPHGFGGISVVRLSGSSSKNIVQSISLNTSNNTVEYKHKIATLVKLKDEKDSVFEDAVVTYFKKPGSYTGEDVFEISCHGNPSVVNKLIAICCTRGARIAEPGEFTKRSFLNGKMDLIQAESVASLIHSKTDESASLNFKMLSGELSSMINKIKQDLVRLLSKVEFELDISEEELQPGLLKDSQAVLNNCKNSLRRSLNSHNSYRMLNEGASVVICGAPNVGKSTLLNFLSGSNRAITSHHPGTTRDYIEALISLNGSPVTLIDTAGLRFSDNDIENKGVVRTKEKISIADCVVYLTDIDSVSNNSLKGLYKKYISVVNKSDLLNKKKLSLLKKQNPSSYFISAKTGYGTDFLLDCIKKHISPSPSLSSSVPIITGRQNNIILKIQKHVHEALSLLSSNKDVYYDLVSLELSGAISQLDGILGKTTTDDILDLVFSSFCVGK